MGVVVELPELVDTDFPAEIAAASEAEFVLVA